MYRARRTLVPVVLALVLSTGATAEAGAQGLSLQQGRTVRGTLAEGDTARYTLEARDSTFVLGQADQSDVPVVVRVVDGEGRQRGRFAGPGVGAMRFALRLDQGGTYTVQVIPQDEKSGAYALTLLKVEPVARDPRRLADQILARYDSPESPGAAVHVWRDGRVLYSRAVGMASLEYGVPFRTDTPTNIGSTSKQFTAFAVLLQEERGALSLDDDIREHLPELPEFEHTVTVRNLLTHTSGLREFLNLLIMTGRRLDHGDWIDRSELVDIVKRQPALQNVPGAEFNYNNTAFGLAALIVERTSGQPFHVFMRENVFGPLGMTRSMVRPSPEHMVPGASEGYTPGPDGYRVIGDLGGAVGAGGIYATVGDLQKWAENMDSPTPKVGSRAIFDAMTTSFVLNDGKESGYGYGLFIDEQNGRRRIHHGGADVAHRSQLAHYPELGAGVTAQGNHAGFNSGIAFEIAEAFFADALRPAPKAAAGQDGPFDPASFDPEAFDVFAGRYALDVAPDFVLTFFREDAKLYTQATGQSRMEIVPTSDSSFALTAVEASVVFHRDEAGKVVGLTLNQNGENHATRLEEEAPDPWKPTADELTDFEGRFFSEEIETFYTFRVEDGALVGYQRRVGDAKLEAGEGKDTFSGGGLNFAFERDRNGEVIGFYVANGRTRDVRFARVR